MVFAPQVSQFSDAQIPFNVAASLCGPAAAIAFARVNGRNPSLKEAQALAEQVGWTAEGGMAGPQSEQRLLEKMGISAELQPSADWGRVTAEVQAGKPVIISTPRHYFTVSDYDPASKRYYVGASGTDLKGGSEWLSAEEIAGQGRGVNGALHLTSTPRGQQQFLEANAPGAPEPIREPVKVPGTEIGVGDVPAPEQPAAVPGITKPTTAPETEEEKAVKRWLAGNQMLDAFSKRLATQFEEPRLPTYRLPGLPSVDPGWRTQRFALPGGR